MAGIPERRKDNLGLAIAASLALHALLLSLQFGVSGMDMPLFGTFGSDRSASIPSLQAILLDQGQPSVAEEKVRPLKTAEIAAPKIEIQTNKAVVNPPDSPVVPIPAEPSTTTASIRETKAPPALPEVREKLDTAAEKQEQPKVVASPAGTAVLGTDQESTWRINAAKAEREKEEKARDERVALEKANEEEALARRNFEQAESLRKAEQVAAAKAKEEALELKRVEEQMRVEEEKRKAAQAAVARANEEALELKRVEEQLRVEEEKRKTAQAALARANEEAQERKRVEEAARKAEQAAVAKANEEALERKRIEEAARKAEQAVAAKAREDALARGQQAQPAIQAERAAEGKSLAGERGPANSASTAPGKPEGRKDGAEGQAPETGSDLAGRALAQARSALPGLPLKPPVNIDRQRRGSILGRDPKDIQLAFYGEGWRQKVERIGSLNYPKLSRNRHYDPLVVTVSINSDGTLAGVRIEKSSGHKELDDAVRRIVEMSAPFAAFPPDLKRSYDVVDITRTWNFLEERPRIYSQ